MEGEREKGGRGGVMKKKDIISECLNDSSSFCRAKLKGETLAVSAISGPVLQPMTGWVFCNNFPKLRVGFSRCFGLHT